MKIIYKVGALLALMSLSIFSFCGGNTENNIVNHYQYFSGHGGLLLRQPNMINPDNCPRNDLYIVSTTHPHYEGLTSLVLASHISGHKLTFHLVGCTEGLPTILHVYSNK